MSNWAFFGFSYLGELPVLPAPDTEKVSQHIGLLLAVKLRHVLVRSHLEGFLEKKRIKNNIEQNNSDGA